MNVEELITNDWCLELGSDMRHIRIDNKKVYCKRFIWRALKNNTYRECCYSGFNTVEECIKDLLLKLN